MKIYPSEKAGLDKIYASIHITISCGNDNFKFCSQYMIKSLKEKSAIMIQPKKLSLFIESLKTLVDGGYDASLKLSQ